MMSPRGDLFTISGCLDPFHLASISFLFCGAFPHGREGGRRDRPSLKEGGLATRGDSQTAPFESF